MTLGLLGLSVLLVAHVHAKIMTYDCTLSTFTKNKFCPSIIELGGAYNERLNTFGQANYFPYHRDDIIHWENYPETYNEFVYSSSVDDISDRVFGEGEISFEYGKMLKIEGQGMYEDKSSTADNRITFRQIGHRIVKTAAIYHQRLNVLTDDEDQEARALKDYSTKEKKALKKANNWPPVSEKKQKIYVHSNLRDVDQATEFTENHGNYYISKVYLGCRVRRDITFVFQEKSELEKINAEVKGTVGFGVWKLGFKGRFEKMSEEEKKKITIQTKASTMGGNPETLDINFNQDFENLEKNFKDQFTTFFNSVDDNNMVVLKVEVTAISGATVEVFSLNMNQMIELMAKTSEAWRLYRQLEKWEAELEINNKYYGDLLTSILDDRISAMQYISTYTSVMKSLQRNQITELKQSYLTYLKQKSLVILKGEWPQKWVDKQLGLDNVEWVSDEELLKADFGILDTKLFPQNQFADIMDGLFIGRTIPLDLDGHPGAWKGPVLFGRPIGIASKILGFYDDVDTNTLDFDDQTAISKAQQFTIDMKDWNPIRFQPIDGAVLELKEHDYGDVNTTKLPNFLTRSTLTGRVFYDVGVYNGQLVVDHVEGGFLFNGPGEFKFFGQELDIETVECRKWLHGSPLDTCTLKYRDGNLFEEYNGQIFFNACTHKTSPHGNGEMLIDGIKVMGEWNFGDLVIPLGEEDPLFKALNGSLQSRLEDRWVTLFIPADGDGCPTPAPSVEPVQDPPAWEGAIKDVRIKLADQMKDAVELMNQRVKHIRKDMYDDFATRDFVASWILTVVDDHKKTVDSMRSDFPMISIRRGSIESHSSMPSAYWGSDGFYHCKADYGDKKCALPRFGRTYCFLTQIQNPRGENSMCRIYGNGGNVWLRAREVLECGVYCWGFDNQQ